MNSVIRICGVACLALHVSACGTLYKLDVFATNDPQQDPGETYVILSGSSELDVNSPEFGQYAAQVEKVLETKGYQRVTGDDLSEVDLGVYLSVNISDPAKKFHTVNTGIYESTTYTEDSPGTRSGGGASRQNPQQVTPQAAHPSPELLAGYSEAGFATTVFTKRLRLVAINLQEYLKDIAVNGKEEALPAEVWSIEVETTGQPADLNEVVPVMVVAAEPYITGSTDDVVNVKLSETDKRIAAIKSH